MRVKRLARADIFVLAGLVRHGVCFLGDVLLRDRDKRCLLEVVNDDALGAFGVAIHQC